MVTSAITLDLHKTEWAVIACMTDVTELYGGFPTTKDLEIDQSSPGLCKGIPVTDAISLLTDVMALWNTIFAVDTLPWSPKRRDSKHAEHVRPGPLADNTTGQTNVSSKMLCIGQPIVRSIRIPSFFRFFALICDLFAVHLMFAFHYHRSCEPLSRYQNGISC